MALPTGVSTCQATFGRALDVLGVGAILEITVTPSHTLIWEATGDIIIPFPVVASTATGTAGTIELPHTNQAGFLDTNGNSIINWHYIVDVVVRRANGTGRSTYQYLLQIPVGQTAIDIDMVPRSTVVQTPGLTPVPVVTSINGETGEVVLTLTDVSDSSANGGRLALTTAERAAIAAAVPRIEHGSTVGVATSSATSITLTVTTPWGIRADGTAYYEAAGATVGEEAVLDINPDTGAPRLTKIAS